MTVRLQPDRHQESQPDTFGLAFRLPGTSQDCQLALNPRMEIGSAESVQALA